MTPTEKMIETLLDRCGLIGLIDLTAVICEARGVDLAGDDLPSAKVWLRNAKRLDAVVKELEA